MFDASMIKPGGDQSGVTTKCIGMNKTLSFHLSDGRFHEVFTLDIK